MLKVFGIRVGLKLTDTGIDGFTAGLFGKQCGSEKDNSPEFPVTIDLQAQILKLFF